MKKSWLVFWVLVAASPAFSDDAPVRVEVTPRATEIFSGEPIQARVNVTNTGKADLILPRPDRTGFAALLRPDNPQLGFSGGVGIVSATGEAPTVTVNPGGSVGTDISLSGNVYGHVPVTFRMGFKVAADAPYTWSNPVTITFKDDKASTLKIEASLLGKEMGIADPQHPGSLSVKLKIINIGTATQDVGMSNVCGLHELTNLTSDTDSVTVASGIVSCAKNLSPPLEVVLKPGESYEQQCRVSYFGENPDPGQVTFRIGVKSIGYVAAWSNPLSFQVAGGTDKWSKHIAYLNGLMHPSAPPREGEQKFYGENGKLMEARTYKNGELNGSYRRYYESGKLQDEISYKDGKMDGKDTQYDENGKLDGVDRYANGELLGYVHYKPDGSINAALRFMRWDNGNYVALGNPCSEKGSPPMAMFPPCRPEDGPIGN